MAVARAGTAPADVALAYQHCRALTKDRARNFYYAFVSLPAQKRLAVYAVYAFCRACDDYADDPEETKAKLTALESHRASLRACFEGNPVGPVFTALLDAARRYHIPQELFEEIITGVQMDLIHRRYATFGDLYKYCYQVASVIGLITIEIFGYKGEQAKAHAIDLGLAMQLVNILRDVKEDAGRDRIYLPREDLQRFGLADQDVLDSRVDHRFVELMRFEAARARAYFRQGARLIPMVSPEARACPATLSALYSRLLRRMEINNWEVFSQRVSLPTIEKVWLATSIWTGLAVKRLLPLGKLS